MVNLQDTHPSATEDFCKIASTHGADTFGTIEGELAKATTSAATKYPSLGGDPLYDCCLCRELMEGVGHPKEVQKPWRDIRRNRSATTRQLRPAPFW